MILIITLVYIANQKVIYQFDARNKQKDDWQGLSDFFECEQFKYFGQTSDDHGISRLFLDLESHQQYRIDALVLNIDGLNVPQVFIDNILENPDLESSVSSMKYCEDPAPELFHNITIIRQHSRRSLWMRIKLHYGGLLSLNLSIIQCQYGCIGCIQVDPIHCLKWELHQFSFNQKLIRNYDGWNEKLDNENDIYCGFLQYVKFDTINYFTQLPPHQDLLIKFFKKDDGIIIIDYIYGQQMTTNQQDHQVEILIKNHPDPIFQLILRNQDPSKQSSIRDFELFYTQPEIMFPNFYEGCQDFIVDQCLKCQKGWIEDEQFLSCHPICGDKIIQGQEECDDGNQISKDGCFKCQFSCTDFCTKCIFGICYQCEDGFLININRTCDPVCGDGILIPYSVEQCEIFEDNNQSGCINCKYSTINNCKNVYISQCLECQSGYYSQGYGCNPYCGDGIVLKQFEDCDDGNQVPFDGCYECKYQCIEGCNICDQGQCILKCDLEYEFVNNNCLSICGDKIVTKEEECDDGNTIQFDGCFNCKYSCPLNCFECYQGICLICNYEYQLLNTNQCKKYLNCGDGLLQLEEECDDGNDQIADGCMDCMIEQNWVCSTILTNSPTQCSFVKYPDLIIDYLNMTQNKQYISIRFSQQIKIFTLQPLSETITFDLLNVEKKKWNSKLSIIQDVGSFVSVGEYVLEIDVLQLLEYRPVMKILINQTVANNDNAVLINHLKQIILQYPKFLDDKQKDYSQIIQFLLYLVQQAYIYYLELVNYFLKF
ncbi:unnamed protein product [Paramecium pentaurelia]|uniref:Uncharacterized protein n=1 Tax=Paramecium pentaurelia TaxID=43138 RepID=A0A8S1Y2H9_9CILI|nr:unnamed protein product [Paramecium pentaurelia]